MKEGKAGVNRLLSALEKYAYKDIYSKTFDDEKIKHLAVILNYDKAQLIDDILSIDDITVSDKKGLDGVSKLYTISDICNLLGVTKVTVYKYIKDGKLEAVKIGRDWKVTQSALNEFINKGTRTRVF